MTLHFSENVSTKPDEGTVERRKLYKKTKIMKNLTKLFVLAIFLFYSCDKNEFEYPDTELTVNELYTYCETDGKRPCNELLNHEGDFVTVVGYYRISNHGYALKGDKFIFYNAPEVGSINTEITILGDTKSVFDKISGFISENSVGEHVKLKISGTIVGHDLATNGACSRGAFLEINSSSAVRLD